jgi:hypothetical protein
MENLESNRFLSTYPISSQPRDFSRPSMGLIQTWYSALLCALERLHHNISLKYLYYKFIPKMDRCWNTGLLPESHPIWKILRDTPEMNLTIHLKAAFYRFQSFDAEKMSRIWRDERVGNAEKALMSFNDTRRRILMDIDSFLKGMRDAGVRGLHMGGE